MQSYKDEETKQAALPADDVLKAPKTCICLKAAKGYEPIHLKGAVFQAQNKKQASPVKGRNKSSLIYSDGEIRKQTRIKANEQTVQVKKYEVPCILLIVYYLADYTIFDTDA